MALTQPQSELLAGYIGRSQALHNQLIGRARNYWANVGYLTDREVELLIERMGWLSTAANTRMSTLTEAYLTRYAAISGGELAAGSATDISTMALRGISEAELFDRVPKTVFGALARKDPFTKAKDLGWNRLESLLATSLQLSKTHTSQNVLDREPRTPRGQRIVGYRRVTAGYNACALCLVASTQRYRRGDLMPIHPACRCGVIPVIGDKDPGLILDRETLDQVHARMAETFGGKSEGARRFTTAEGELMSYRDVILTRTNSEIGPVLTVKKHKFYQPLDRK